MSDPVPTSGNLLDRLFEGLSWNAARSAVDAVRYRPRHLDLVLACGDGATETPGLVRWSVDAGNSLLRAQGVPHALVAAVAARAAAWLGPTASALLRWVSGATALAADGAGGRAAERSLRAGAVHPGLLVPHLHEVAILAVDMRGFSRLTRELHDTQYLTDLISGYLTELTTVVERHRGIVFQYTGDGLLAVFLPELRGGSAAETLAGVVDGLGPELHATFDDLYARWRADWARTGRPRVPIGLGVGVSFGSTTIGFIGPAGKKHIGVIGEPVNLAAFLCSQAPAGEILVDRAAYARAGADAPVARSVRLRSKKAHQRIDAIRLLAGRRSARALARMLQPSV